ADKYLRDLLAVPPDAPVNLWSLSEGDPIQRPVTSLIKLSMLAIHGSEKKRLTLQQIYRAIEARFTYYRETEGKQWQNSIRHSLSLRSAFVKVRRPAHEPGKGFYWQLDFTNGDGLKRPRKR
ncbi:fork head domain-containing protein, partial [Mycena crocata]